MKAKVIRAFRDKNNNKKYIEKNTIFEAAAERIQVLKEKGFVEVEEKIEHPSVLDGSIDEVKKSTDGLTVEEVKALLEAEKVGDNRKGLVSYFESLIEEVESNPTEEGE
ncbi:hypothetical protein [Halolactibacillus sp. JCM 19043]|uniref:hypothetical protein n=1 Tax=Halolactibacillus sp. JCM 19043 TaxID=1460638 RepID=UPI0007807800|nr:hypothetical protein [Halolactibacillus sp. JCM 19043]